MRILFTFLLTSLASTAMAQSINSISIPNAGPGVQITMVPDTTPVNWDTMKRPQSLVDVKPRFNGNLNQYLISHVKVPKDSKLEGRITTNFIVDTAGHISHVTVEGKGPKDKLTPLEKEIVRVVSTMPPWIPGILKGRHVPVKYSLPINLN
ncbi:MAG: hypothetical protein EOP51_04040 [Sphingobacteriales bacterium]|nr:MAG: hypothetical protein EOP51_04040 [Sphingobacteriales bacterium]